MDDPWDLIHCMVVSDEITGTLVLRVGSANLPCDELSTMAIAST